MSSDASCPIDLSDEQVQSTLEELVRKSADPELELEPWYLGSIRTPLGTMLAVADDEGLHTLEFFDSRHDADTILALGRKSHHRFIKSPHELLAQIEDELTAYFAGERFAFSIPLVYHGTPFECLVWQALREIPAGETRTYRQIAERVQGPTATRAVGRANGRNPLAVVVPCHRVIGVNGNLTGYAAGLWRKRWLLDHERQYRGGVYQPDLF